MKTDVGKKAGLDDCVITKSFIYSRNTIDFKVRGSTAKPNNRLNSKRSQRGDVKNSVGRGPVPGSFSLVGAFEGALSATKMLGVVFIKLN